MGLVNNTSNLKGLPKSELNAWLKEPFHLALSAGFFGFYAHTGMLSALVERGHRPVSVSGSSAGALISGLYASGLEPNTISKIILSVSRKDFWDPGIGFGLLKGEKFMGLLEEHLPVKTFEACRIPLALSVYDIRRRKTQVVRKGDLVRAISASCALPGLFHPVMWNGQRTSDGGIKDRHGLEGARDKKRVFYHHLASKSPWRRAESRGLVLPTQKGVVSLSLQGLARVSPFKMAKGLTALNLAYNLTTELLDQSVLR